MVIHLELIACLYATAMMTKLAIYLLVSAQMDCAPLNGLDIIVKQVTNFH